MTTRKIIVPIAVFSLVIILPLSFLLGSHKVLAQAFGYQADGTPCTQDEYNTNIDNCAWPAGGDPNYSPSTVGAFGYQANGTPCTQDQYNTNIDNCKWSAGGDPNYNSEGGTGIPNPAPTSGNGTQNPAPPPNTNLIVCAGGDQCGWKDLVILAGNLIRFLIYIAIPLAALSFAWAGFTIMTAAGDEGKVKKGKEIFEKVAYGIVFALAAWLIVNVILTALLAPGISLLG